MLPDSNGYLWLHTQYDLIRYDGSNFKMFSLRPAKDSGTHNYNVADISYIASQKKIFIRTVDGDLYTIKNGKPVFYQNGDKNTPYYNEVTGGFPNLELFNKFNLPSLVLIKQYGWGLDTKQILPISSTDFMVLASDNMHVLYYKNGLKYKDILLDQPYTTFLKAGRYNLIADVKGNLYLYETAAEKFTAIRIAPGFLSKKAGDNDIPAYYWDAYNGESYCYYNDVFYQLSVDEQNREVKFIPKFSIKKNGHVFTGILYDSLSSTFFLRTLTEGLFQVKIKRIQTFNLSQMIGNTADPSNIISYAILKTSDSTVLSPTGYEFRMTGKQITVEKKGNITGNRETLAMLGDTAILCAYGGRLVYYLRSDGFQKMRVFNDSLYTAYSPFFSLLQPEGDSVWAFSNKGIFSLRNGRYRTFLSNKSQEGPSIFDSRIFFRLSDEEVFISSGAGLFKFKTSFPYRIDTIAEMSNRNVRHISKYNDALILSVYRYGLFVYKDNHFYKVPIDYNPEPKFCHSTYITTNGDVWIPTDKGFYRSSINSILDGALKPGIKPFFFVYGTNDGIDNTEFNGGGSPCYAVLANGQLFYPSMGGIVSFNAGELKDKITNASFGIENFLIDEKVVDDIISDTIQIPLNYKFFAIDFSVPNFGEPENLVLEYSFDNQEWKRIRVKNGVQRLQLLENVSSGYHQLVVRKRTGFGKNDYVYHSITLFKKKALYEQLWFFPLIALGLIFLVLGLIKLQTNNINRNRKHLQQLVDAQTADLSKSVAVQELLINIISHDMTTPLRHISFIAGFLSKGLEKDANRMNIALLDIQQSSEKILAGSLNIINWMKYNNQRIAVEKKQENLFSLVSETADIYKPVAKSKGITIINEVDKSQEILADYTILSTIINNIINNAVKYSKAGEIRISSVQKDMAETIIRIIDTGRGIDETNLRIITAVLKGHVEVVRTTSKLSTGLGYIMIAELAKIHGLFITVASEVNKGTTVSIIIKD